MSSCSLPCVLFSLSPRPKTNPSADHFQYYTGSDIYASDEVWGQDYALLCYTKATACFLLTRAHTNSVTLSLVYHTVFCHLQCNTFLFFRILAHVGRGRAWERGYKQRVAHVFVFFFHTGQWRLFTVTSNNTRK